MKKIYKLGLSLGATTSIVAPITTVACGSDNKHVQVTNHTQPTVAPTPSVDVTLTNPTPQASVVPQPWKPKVDYMTELADTFSQVTKPIFVTAPNKNDYAYTTQTLKAEADSIYNGQPGAIWAGYRGNPLMAAIYSTASLVRAVANEYGYNKEVNGTSPRNEFLKNQYMNIIVDENSIDNNQTEEIKNQMKFLGSLKQESISQTAHLPFSLGETRAKENNMSNIFEYAKIKYDEFPETYNNDSEHIDSLLGLTNFAIWDDEINPGKSIMSLYTDSGLYRELSLDKVKDNYAVIEESKFQSDFIPYAKATILGLLEVIRGIGGILPLPDGVDPMFLDQVNYLLKKNLDTVTGEFKFNDSEIEGIFKKLNNGSLNWLAIKSVYLGFDKSFTTKEYSIFTNMNGLATVNYGDSIKGIKDTWDAMADLTKWLGWLDSNGNYLDDRDSLFNATDIIDKNYITGKISNERLQKLEQYIQNNEIVKP